MDDYNKLALKAVDLQKKNKSQEAKQIYIDLLKIDTEGYELEVLKGLEEFISRVSVILFEHHYDNMIKKGYTFSDIHHLLKNNNFYRIFKIKMPFRRSFEYVYVRKINESLSNNY